MAARWDGFFQGVWRLNALLLAGVGIGALAGGVALAAIIAIELVEGVRTQQVAVAPAPSGDDAAPPAPERLRGFAPLGGTGLLSAQTVRVDPVRGAGTSLSRAYAKSSENVLDWLIYDPRTGEARPLIGARPNLLMEARLLQWRPDPEGPAEDIALFIRRVTADSNGDGVLSSRDQAIFELAAPDGTGRAPLAVEGELVNLTHLSRGEAVLLVEADADGSRSATAVHLDLIGRRILRRVALPLNPPAGAE